MASPVAFRWGDHDRCGWAAPLAAAGALAAAAMAAFGLPPLDVHGPLHNSGVMGPLCGMTRAVRHLARLELVTALRYNPAVPLVPLIGISAVARWIGGRRNGRWLEIEVRRRWLLVCIGAAGVAALTVHQQMNVALLR